MDWAAEDWRQRWSSQVCRPDEAIHAVRPGRRIFIGSGAGEPARLVEAMVSAGKHLADNEILHLMTLGDAPYAKPGMEGRFRHTAFFIGPNVRQAVHDGRADFMPVFLSEIPQLIRSGRIGIDVALIQVTPPDDHGYVSLGVSVDIVRAAVEAARLVLAEVNPRMPRTLGDSFLHVDRIDRLVPVDYPLPEHIPPPLDEVAREIGRHVASLIQNGATLQIGIGRIASAIVGALDGKEDLGLHTEMLSDEIRKLFQAGVLTGKRKTLLPGKMVTSFVMGSRDLYEWVDNHPGVEMRSSGFTNDPAVIARNDNMIAVNGALAVDLTGQVAADTVMERFFSGIGGQVDFIRGAVRSRGGKAIIVLPSTARGGTVSRIQAALKEGAGVVTSRGDVRHVVTEYGVADLWGKNIRQRATALMEIAHPDFRSELLAAAKRRRFVFPDQVAPRGRYPWEDACHERLPGGDEVRVRPVRLSDEGTLQGLFYRLSDESTYRRFMAHKKVHPHEEMQRLVDLDYEQNMALVVCVPDGEEETIVAMARFDVDPATRLADIAFVVRDEWQGKGIGSLLMRRLTEIASARGLAGFTADVLATNKPMLSVFQKSGLKVTVRPEDGCRQVTARFREPGSRPPRRE
jgi:acyl-CoA hydrolase/GNAT superfamily N-acetyltransferase